MPVIKNPDGKIILTRSTETLNTNRKQIESLNNNTFFKHEFTNKIGRELVYYLCNISYHNLINPEPVNLNRNTLSKCLTRLKVLDTYINKSLDKYEMTDMNNFIRDYMDEKIISNQNVNSYKNKHAPKKPLKISALKNYIMEFKRFWKIYRQYEIHSGKKFDSLMFEWALDLKSPRVKREYEDFPDLSIKDTIKLSNKLFCSEYKVRTLLAVNLMARKCEICNLKKSMIRFKNDDEVWVKLPNVKKNSTQKVSVQLYSFVKKPLLDYLKDNDFKDNDIIFPTKVEAYAKNIKKTAREMFNVRLTPKTLRKLGVCVAEKLGYSRSEVERIGAWSVNSPVIAHYFKRKEVPIKKEEDLKIEKSLNEDIYTEIDKLKHENEKKDSTIKDLKDMQNEMKVQMQKQNNFILEFVEKSENIEKPILKNSKLLNRQVVT